MANIIKGVTRSPIEMVQFVEKQFKRALDASHRRRNKLYENLAYYFSNQIPDNIKGKLSQEQRDAMVYNISHRKVVGLVGSLLRNNFNTTFMSVDGKNTTLYETLQDMLEADENSSNWDYQFMTFIKYGLIEDAVMELQQSDRESPLGNLMFECCQPGSVIIDQNWRTNNSRDMQECWKYVYLSPDTIMDIYPDTTDEVRAELMERIRSGREYGDKDQESNRDYQTTLGGDYMVLQYTYMQSEKTSKEIDIKTGIELPETQDAAYKMQWIQINGVNPEYVREIKYNKKMVKLVTTIPALLKRPAAEGNHPFQIERMPFFPWACDRINGETQSIIDIIKPMQDCINKRENLLNNVIETSAYGSMAIDPAIVGNDPEAKKTLQENFSNPRLKFFTQEGALSSGKTFFLPIPKNNPPNEIFAQINHLWESVDRVLPINAAADGRSESSAESGILFSMKQNAIEVAQSTLVRGLMAVLTEMGDAYFRAAKAYYSGVEREFTKPNGERFKINEVIPLPSGDIGIRNDMSSLQNVKTLVKMGADSPNTRFSRRLTAIDLLKTVPQNLPGIQVEMLAEVIDTVDINEKSRGNMDIAVGRARKLAAAREEKEMKDLTAPPPPPQPQQPPAPKEPSQSISFKDLPLDGQVQLAAKAGLNIGGQPMAPQGAPSPNPIEAAMTPLMGGNSA